MWGLIKGILTPGTRQAVIPVGTQQKNTGGGTRPLEIDSLEYIPLPRAPLRWETSQTIFVPEAVDDFEVHDAAWQIASVEKLRKGERPDPAYRQVYPSGAGLFLVDDLGKADDLGPLKSSAVLHHRNGQPGAKLPFQHDVYRTGVHALGHGMAIMSRDCVLHAYDDKLQPILTVDLAAFPEILALRQKFGIPDEKVKNHLRCVALSQEESRYLFTAVDEAYCSDMSGNRLWSVKLPIKEGWSRVAAPSFATNTSEEVQSALALMGLSLPVAPEQIKSRYRELVKKWHPDLNPSDRQAGAKMRALGSAMEALTGLDASHVATYAGATFEKVLSRHDINVDGVQASVTMSMVVSELFAADWIYAASFAAGSDAVYLAGYSGKVFALNPDGTGVRVYDIGSVPSQIVDTGDYLYLLTGTRLYVLRGNELHAVIDVYGAGRLMVANNGFGFIQNKALRWYAQDGKYLGTLVAKDPIRLIYQQGGNTIVETRQRRVIIQGMPNWW